MHIVDPAAVLIDTTHTDPYRMIERVGRLCYKSEDKITEDSSSRFVSAMYKSNHHAMLEHYHVIFRLDKKSISRFKSMIDSTCRATRSNLWAYINITDIDLTPSHTMAYVSGSFRAFIDILNKATWEVAEIMRNDLTLHYPELFPEVEFDPSLSFQYKVELTTWDSFIQDVKDEMWLDDGDKDEILSNHVPWTVVFTCDRGVSHELVRHRPCGFAQESTRYCNYSADKFDNGVSFIKPIFFEADTYEYDMWKQACGSCEEMYMQLLNRGATPQQARSVLNNSVKTEIAVTATEKEWQHIINLRYHGTTGAPHPQMVELMSLVYDDICLSSEDRIK